MELAELDKLFRAHARNCDERSIDTWLTHETLARYLEWTPTPLPNEMKLAEVGCYQPSVGYYFHLGWKEIIGIFKESGECNQAQVYTVDQGMARMIEVDVEREKTPVHDNWADALVMMEVFEHFGIDPMHALWEANRILKPGGRLLLSTPNAASFNNVRRVLRGSAPFGAQEFNGVSTNRHNRIYDAQELSVILAAAGFRAEKVASRSYRQGRLSGREFGTYILVRLLDRLGELFSGRKRERGEWLFVQAIKETAPRERYPSQFYFDSAKWPSWIQSLRGSNASNQKTA